MNDPQATYVATVHPFTATEGMLRQRQRARKAKARRDPGGFVILEALTEEIRSIILDPRPSSFDPAAAWFGSADRLAHVHPSGLVELLTDADGPRTSREPGKTSRLAFVSVVGPRSYWPESEALAYRAALKAFTRDDGGVERVTCAAKALVGAGRDRECRWGPDEWHFRVLAAIAGWVYWDDEPGAFQGM
jgi:hypothetical protein